MEFIKFINDNIVIFIEVQKRSQKEINDVKVKVVFLEEFEGYKQDLKVLKEVVKEIQILVKFREWDMEVLRSIFQIMEFDVYIEVCELVSFKQEQQVFKEVVDLEWFVLQVFMEKFFRFEEFVFCFLEEIWRLEEEFCQLKFDFYGLKEDGGFRYLEVFEVFQ